ncbi:tripartite tricarboxylate transporter TctB family protein [Lachnospiraceae bacterium OF11-28]|nr:tripartite tricarboxylate transporter TctB family protein [Lachnospiraceae bacterium OF11-28]
MPEEAISGCPAENDIMKNRGLSYEKRKYYCGHCLCGSCLYVIVTCLSYPRAEAYGTGVPGPGLWPGIIAALLLICSVGLIAGTLMMKKEDLPELPMWTPGTKRVYISMAILLVYMLVLSTVGFIIPSVIMLFAFCQWFHRGAVWKNAVISIAVILVIYYVFKNFLNVPIDFGMFSI